MSYKTYTSDLKDEKIERLMTALRKVAHEGDAWNMKGACHPEGCCSSGIAIRALQREGDEEWESVEVYGI